MLRHKFWLFEFISISQTILEEPSKYNRAFLHIETDDNDLNYVLLHQLEVIAKAISQLHESIRHKSDDLARMQALLHNRSGFSHRQLVMLRHALKHPSVSFTVASHQNSQRVGAKTAKNDLDELSRTGLLLKVKVGEDFNIAPWKILPENWRKSLPGPSDRSIPSRFQRLVRDEAGGEYGISAILSPGAEIPERTRLPLDSARKKAQSSGVSQTRAGVVQW